MSNSFTYRDAGVDIDAGNRAVDLIKEKVRSTFGPEVLTGIGGFGSLFAFGGYASRCSWPAPTGSGPKLKIAIALDRHDTVGVDLVNHCVNDILTCGATPLFFLDYVALGKLVPGEDRPDSSSGLAEACRANGCALVGGETAEMPGIYAGGRVRPGRLHRRGRGARSGGGRQPDPGWGPGVGPAVQRTCTPTATPWSGGCWKGQPLDRYWPELGRTLGDELLAATPLLPGADPAAAGRGDVDVRGMAHITGGGHPRQRLADHTGRGGRRVPVGRAGRCADLHDDPGRGARSPRRRCCGVFNMGLGFVSICPASDLEKVRRLAPQALQVGEIVAGGGRDRVEVIGA